ncbi:MAG: Mut7-C RNAse domain-containing protein [Candidatus Cloacimonetes bacterium]|nr:Mut7-C RNAse domain-containing protein [Candidatus Cloacimonadota bacterium]
MKNNPRFAVDKMLGKLAKWLRILGYDTFYKNKISNATLLSIANSDNRILITRNHFFKKRKHQIKIIFITKDNLKDQLLELKNEIKLSTNRMFIRCPICNHKTTPIDKEYVKDIVPAYVYQTQERFFQCLLCGKVYWAGTHLKNAKKFISNLDFKN